MSPQIWRSKESYLSKDISKREKQLKNLKNQGQKIRGIIKTKFSKKRYKNDIVAFCEEQIILPETKKLVKLEEWQKEYFFKPIFEEDLSSFLLSIPKKNGKSALVSFYLAWNFFCDIDAPNEIYICSNDLLQSQSIIFRKVIQTIEANSYFKGISKITDTYILNKSNGSRIIPLARDYRGAQGLAPGIIVFDELASFDQTEAERLYEMLQLSPIRERGIILITSTVSYDKETIFGELFDKALTNSPDSPNYDPYYGSYIVQGENISSFVTERYLDSQKKRLRPATFAMLHLNKWQEQGQGFITEEMYDKCVNPLLVKQPARKARVVCGLDSSIRNDSVGIVAVSFDYDSQRFIVIDHYCYAPEGEDVQYSSQVEAPLIDMSRRYDLLACGFDNYQMIKSSQYLRDEFGINMVEVTQSEARLEKATGILWELIKSQQIEFYPDETIRNHILSAGVKEKKTGKFRLIKGKSKKKKIDLAVALSFAVLVALEEDFEESGDIDVLVGGWGHYGGGARGQDKKPVPWISDVFNIYR